MGRVSDIYGRRRIFLLCLSIFGIGSILCGLAPVFGQMWDLGFLNAFNTAMALCLIATIPALFLWGRKAAVVEQLVPDSNAAPDPHEADTVVVAGVAAADVLKDPAPPTELAQPPLPPINGNGGNGGNIGRNPRKRRRLIIAAASLMLVVLLVVTGVFAAFLWQAPASPLTSAHPMNPATATATPVSGPRMIQLALLRRFHEEMKIDETVEIQTLCSGWLGHVAVSPHAEPDGDTGKRDEQQSCSCSTTTG